MNVNEEPSRPILIIMLLAALGISTLCLDLWDIVVGATNLGQHIPFLFPMVMGFCIVVTVVVHKATQQEPAHSQQRP